MAHVAMQAISSNRRLGQTSACRAQIESLPVMAPPPSAIAGGPLDGISN